VFTDQPTSYGDVSSGDERPLGEVEDELASLAAQMAAGMCRSLELLAEFDRRGGWDGWPSCAAWLAWRCGLTARTAREHVRVAHALVSRPLIRAGFARGELSYAKVRALTRAGEAVDEQELLRLAHVLTAAQLDVAMRVYCRVTSEEARETQAGEKVSWQWDSDGSLVLQARLAPEDGALVLQALEAARQRLWKDGEQERRGSAEPRELELRPSNVDALVAVADAALAEEGKLRGGADRYQVVVHVDQAALRGDRDGASVLEEGPALAPETARRLACDASVVTITEQEGAPLDLGRKTRTISWALRRALKARDRGCRYPGCENRRFLDAHHIHHWANGGATTLDNLLLLCRRHHRALHEGEYTIDEHGRFFNRFGCEIHGVPPPLPGPAKPFQDKKGVGPLATGCGERMDLSLTIGALTTCIDPDRLRRFPELPRGLVLWSDDHFVRLTGRFDLDDDTDAGIPLFVLPEGYRPRVLTSCQVTSRAGATHLRVEPNGTVTTDSPAAGWIQVTDVHFQPALN
jgi:hypothetical protein